MYVHVYIYVWYVTNTTPPSHLTLLPRRCSTPFLLLDSLFHNTTPFLLLDTHTPHLLLLHSQHGIYARPFALP